ncbi:hypothetical protein [Salinicola sp. RZ23]|uniref:P-loop ATPase, Sll1717 family n=1 Tax=Salinicola sp. RZ23 TaxID=1949087 RepID=UPI001300172A|nr:hypothetical protein [Salinicola sp. RZ23]
MLLGPRQEKKSILQNISFGKRIAEEESSELSEYFVETDQWKRIVSGEVDVVYGAKGTGKSAIYSLLLQKEYQLLDNNVILKSAEKPQGAPAFKTLETHLDITEKELSNLWKLYFLSLLGAAFREYGIENRSADNIIRHLGEARLLPQKINLSSLLSSAIQYVKNLTKVESTETELKLDSSGNIVGVVGRIVLREPSADLIDKGFNSVDELLEEANQALIDYGYSVWILLDRLDVAFYENATLETRALRSLFRVYLDFMAYSKLHLKIFIRDDIWARIVDEGFREASHITKTLTIGWDPAGLMNLVVRRFVNNEAVVSLYGLNVSDVLSDTENQTEVFYKAFPEQVDIGAKKSTSFDWILSRIVDGNRVYAPRELIHLLEVAKNVEIDRIEIGDRELSGDKLFSEKSFKNAHEEVSRERLEKTILAENSELRPAIKSLSEQKTEQYLETLSRLWDTSDEETARLAARLVDIGFFQKRDSKGEDTYWVPFIYRPALNMVQGKAVK